MTKEEARQIIATWLVSSKGANGQRGYIEGWFDKEDVEAFHMAIEALSDRPTGKWIYNPKDAFEVMFKLPRCSLCGHESVDAGRFCSNCGARMKV